LNLVCLSFFFSADVFYLFHPEFVIYCLLHTHIHTLTLRNTLTLAHAHNPPPIPTHTYTHTHTHSTSTVPNKEGGRGTEISVTIAGSWAHYRARVLQYFQQLAVITPYSGTYAIK
jgi:DNA topoisomerase VI subunit B